MSYKRGVLSAIFSRKMLFSDGKWKYVKMSNLFEPVIDRGYPNERVLTIVQGTGAVPRDQIERHISYNKESVNSYKLVKKGDFILHLRSFEGGLEYVNEKGIVSPAYTILRAKEKIVEKFYYSYFRSFEFIQNKLRTSVEGIRDGKSINMQTFWNIRIPYPTYDKQIKIADFVEGIDDMINNANNYISNIEELKKELLKEMFI